MSRLRKSGQRPPRLEVVSLRFSSETVNELKQCAEKAGLPLAVYIEDRVLGRPVTARVDVDFFNLIRKLGGLIKFGLSNFRFGCDKDDADLEITNLLRTCLSTLDKVCEVLLQKMEANSQGRASDPTIATLLSKVDFSLLRKLNRGDEDAADKGGEIPREGGE